MNAKTSRLRIIMIVIAVSISMSISTPFVFAQTWFDEQETPLESGAMALETEFMREELSTSLVDLKEKLGNLITESERAPGVEQPKLPEPTVVERLQADILESRMKMNEEFEATQREIDELIRQSANKRDPDVLPAPLQNQVNPPTAADQTNTTPAESETPTTSEPESAETDPTFSIRDTIDSLKSKQSQTNTASKAVSGLVSTKPVDKMALADNVFAAGDAAAAGRLYGELLKETSSAVDQLWVKYQMAACYRATKQYDESERLLREITNVKTDRFPVPQARWWLSVMEQRVSQESKLRSLEESLQSLTKESVDADN